MTSTSLELLTVANFLFPSLWDGPLPDFIAFVAALIRIGAK